MTLPENISKIISRIEEGNREAFVVGGCVRDSLLGKSPSDWDITTSALPSEIITIFSDCTVITTGIKHGTVTLILENKPIEITTYRIDGNYTDNRRPDSIVFSKNLAEDLKRRDFTINSMAYSPKAGIVDLFCGQGDLESKIIRAVGNPVNRFSEDALRIMRAIRFSAVLGFEIEPKTRDALFSCRHLLSNIASERITEELNKILLSQNYSKVLSEYLQIFSCRVFGTELQKDISSELFCRLNELPESLTLRLAVFLFLASDLFDLSPKNVADIFFRNLRYDSKTVKRCKAILENIEKQMFSDRVFLRKQISILGFDLVHNIIDVQFALKICNCESFNGIKRTLDLIQKENDCCTVKQLALTGSDLIDKFRLDGKEVGNALEFLLDAVINDECDNKKDSLLDYYKNKKIGL